MARRGARLTNREIYVVRSIAEGKTNREIAEELFVSEGTVESQLHVIQDELMGGD